MYHRMTACSPLSTGFKLESLPPTRQQPRSADTELTNWQYSEETDACENLPASSTNKCGLHNYFIVAKLVVTGHVAVKKGGLHNVLCAASAMELLALISS